MKKSSLENIILTQFPYPIAVRYQQMLAAETIEIKARRCTEIYEAGLRALTLGILGQYIQHDSEVVNDATLNKVALRLIDINRPPSLGTWMNVFFTGLKAYQGHRDRFFMAELYDFYWDISVTPHCPRKGTQQPFQKLVELRNAISHTPPTDPAAWQSLYTEIDGYLHDILNRFLFLAHYDLIHIIEQAEDSYVYDVYTGQQVQRASSPLTKTSLKDGWCYLSKTTGELLPVHPLIIFWEDELNQGKIHTTPEVVVYDSYKVQQIKYWHSSAGALETRNPDLLDLFIALIVERLEAQRPQREIYRLNWGDLKALSRQIALQRMGDAQDKYDPRLYLQRQKTRETFDEFLQSDKGCLILTGNSGVGKSNFLISLIEEFQESEEVCTLAYNGARLDPIVPIENILAQDFNYHLKLKSREQPDGPAILKMIDELENVRKRHIILFVDAINENADGKALLRQLDRFIENHPYPWLKVVITSRPGAWQSIKRGVRLAEHRYYRQTGRDDLGIEITGFTASDYEIRVEPFAYEELPRVYEKYRLAYGLVTTYEDVPAVIKKLLRDPLTLLLTAETYRGREIPMHLRSGELIEKYIQMLLTTERLSKNDLHFLRQEIVPRLFSTPYPPKLTLDDIEDKLTTKNRSLYELIFNEDPLPNGKKVNQSYINLADSAIMVEQGNQLEQAVGFKYERFYEYFGGVYLSKISLSKDDPVDFYLSFTTIIESKAYFWGVIKNTFFEELKYSLSEDKKRVVDIFVALAQTGSKVWKEMLTASLVEFGNDNPEAVRDVLNSMIESELSKQARLRRLIPTAQKLPKEKSLSSKNILRVAIEVSSILDFRGILELAARDDSPEIRSVAIQHIYYLWLRKPDAGHAILQSLSQGIQSWWIIPDLTVIESCVSLSLTMFFKKYNEPYLRIQLQSIWHENISRLLLVPKQKSSNLSKFAKYVRNTLLAVTVKMVIRRAYSMEKEFGEEVIFNIKDVASFFELGEARKDRFLHLINYIDSETTDINNIREDLKNIAQERDLFTTYLTGLILIAHIMRNRMEVLDLLENMIELSLTESPPTPSIAIALIALKIALLYDNTIDERTFSLYESTMFRFYKETRCRGMTESQNFLWAEQGAYPYILFKKTSQLTSPIFTEFLESVRCENDRGLLKQFLDFLTGTAITHGTPSAAIQTMIQLIDFEQPADNLITGKLSLLRLQYPDEVDIILLEQGVPLWLQKIIQDRSLGDSLNAQFMDGFTNFVADIVALSRDKGLLYEVQHLFYSATDSANVQECLRRIIQEILNRIYGEPLF